MWSQYILVGGVLHNVASGVANGWTGGQTGSGGRTWGPGSQKYMRFLVLTLLFHSHVCACAHVCSCTLGTH